MYDNEFSGVSGRGGRFWGVWSVGWLCFFRLRPRVGDGFQPESVSRPFVCYIRTFTGRHSFGAERLGGMKYETRLDCSARLVVILVAVGGGGKAVSYGWRGEWGN